MDSIGSAGPAPSNSLADIVERLEIGDELFWDAQHLGPPDWIGHVPFAFWLVRSLRPAVVLGLGGSDSNSHSAFCQAIAALGLECRAFAVDLRSEERAGSASPDGARSANPSYAPFSTVLELEPSQLTGRFQHGSIDLLHIAGANAHQAAREALQTLSDRSVVLMDNTAPYLADHDVRQLWSELASSYPHFEFLHADGLGVIGTGKQLPEPLRELFALSRDAEGVRRVRSLFELSGEALALRYATAQLKDQLSLRDRLYSRTRSRIKELAQTLDVRLAESGRQTNELASLRETVAARENQINRMRKSAGWRLTAPLRVMSRGIKRMARAVRRASGVGAS